MIYPAIAFAAGVLVGVLVARRYARRAYETGIRRAFFSIAAHMRETGADDYAAILEHAAKAGER